MEHDTKKLELYAGPADGKTINIPSELIQYIGELVYVPCQIDPSRSIEIHAYELCVVEGPRRYTRLEHRYEVDKAELDDID